jgi:uncharacterized protein (DUF697 family)
MTDAQAETPATPSTPSSEPSPEAVALRASATDTVRRYVYGSMAAGIFLLPGLDTVAILGIQVKMLHALCRLYNIPFSENAGKSPISGLIGSLGSAAVARGTFGSLVKLIPVFGPLAGSVAMPVIAGGATHAVGKIFIKHFEHGGSILDFNSDRVKQDFMDLYEEGKKVATVMRSKDNGIPDEDPPAASAEPPQA